MERLLPRAVLALHSLNLHPTNVPLSSLHSLWPCARTTLLMGVTLTLCFKSVQAQAPEAIANAATAPVSWHLVVDGRKTSWPVETAYPLDSLHVAAHAALLSLQRAGYYFARIDSMQVDRNSTPTQVRLYATRGVEVEVGEVVLRGATALDSTTLLQQMNTRPGRRLDAAQLEADLAAILLRYEQAGFPLAQVQIADLSLIPDNPPRLYLVLTIDEGRSLTLKGVVVEGKGRTRAGYVARVAGLRMGQSLTHYDPDAIRGRLEATTFFKSIGTPELIVEADSLATLRIPLEEEAPGAFDLVLGYLPAAGNGTGSLVGNGHLLLRNLFGQGRLLSMKLNRLPGQVSSLNARVADPYIAGLPLRMEARFNGVQQDSTYGKQQYGLQAGLQLASGFEAFGTLSRELTKPGQAGVRLINGRQRIARSEALFYGFGVRFERIDRRFNPRHGLFVETNLEQGRKSRSARIAQPEGDPIEERTSLRQERLRLEARGFLPTFARQVLALGGEGAVLLSDVYDASDLFRFGGAASLRGYDEERFLGRAVARAFIEYRYQLDRTSYGFIFFDLGYVETPAFETTLETRGFYPGYGLGAQVGTDLGLVKLSLAANPEDPAAVRAHLGLSIGL